MGGHWKIINRIILDSMRGVTLAQLANPPRDNESTNHDGAADGVSHGTPVDHAREGHSGCEPRLPAATPSNPDSTPRA